MVRKKPVGWRGEPWRHAQAAMGISTKGVTREERELRRQTLEFLAEKESVPAGQQSIVVDMTDQLVEDNTEWAADKVEDRLNELGFWNDLSKDPPRSEKDLFGRIANSDAPDDVYTRLGHIVMRDNPSLSSTQADRVANDSVTAGARLLAKAAWRDSGHDWQRDAQSELGKLREQAEETKSARDRLGRRIKEDKYHAGDEQNWESLNESLRIFLKQIDALEKQT